jgi:hypothetical protein
MRRKTEADPESRDHGPWLAVVGVGWNLLRILENVGQVDEGNDDFGIPTKEKFPVGRPRSPLLLADVLGETWPVTRERRRILT